MDSYKFMNSVRKVKRRQYDNLAVIAFFPPTVFRQSHILRRASAVRRSVSVLNGGCTLTPYLRPVNPRQGSSGGSTKYGGFMANGIAIISARMVNYMFN